MKSKSGGIVNTFSNLNDDKITSILNFYSTHKHFRVEHFKLEISKLRSLLIQMMQNRIDSITKNMHRMLALPILPIPSGQR